MATRVARSLVLVGVLLAAVFVLAGAGAHTSAHRADAARLSPASGLDCIAHASCGGQLPVATPLLPAAPVQAAVIIAASAALLVTGVVAGRDRYSDLMLAGRLFRPPRLAG